MVVLDELTYLNNMAWFRKKISWIVLKIGLQEFMW